MFFYAIVFGLPVLHLLWWWMSRRATRGVAARGGGWRRWLVAGGHVVAAVLLLSYLWTIGLRWQNSTALPPLWLLGGTYIWFLVLLVPALAVTIVAAIVAGCGNPRVSPPESGGDEQKAPTVTSETSDRPVASASAPLAAPSRRELIGAGIAAVPQLALLGSVGISIPRLREFRIRRFEIPLASLPADLDGLTIAHLSDLHAGKFSDEGLVRRIIEATNDLRPDLALFTGDLIDFSLEYLPLGLDLMRRVDPRCGRFIVEGNHDLFEDRRAFAEQMQAANVGYLRNEAETVRVRGVDLQVLGTRWAGRVRGRADDPFATGAAPDHLGETLAKRRPDAFSILLAHHPHEFDRAAAAGVDLTLAGHTHGGQLMLSEALGAGPLLFKYWSGLYRDANRDAALVVSNGVGNWFPLRVNAPAEIVHVTLRRQA
jgi:predicted MPP superfamily phosphohydrolase